MYVGPSGLPGMLQDEVSDEFPREGPFAAASIG